MHYLLSQYELTLVVHTQEDVLPSKLSKEDFTLTDLTSNSVTVNWNSVDLKAKGVKRVTFKAKSTDTKEKPFTISTDVGHKSTPIWSLKPSTRYHLTVGEDNLADSTTEIAIFVTLPTGNDLV